MEKKQKENKNDLYSLKRKLLKEKRVLRNKVIGNDTVDGSTFQRFYGESTKTRRALKIEMFGSKSKASKYGDDTSIEKFVEDFLVSKNIEFKKQKAIRFINVDFFVPSKNLVIQVNGDYWHCNPKLYPTPKNNIQKKNIEKDKIATKIIMDAGLNLLEIWESDIKEDPLRVQERILAHVL
jgi:G:T-mismatch repair DNA endonuclease (very short patch repair protein)